METERPRHLPSEDRTESERSLRLTSRQRQVLEAVVRGGENKEIAAELGLAEQTVKSVISRLFRKFGVTNRAALAHSFALFELTGTFALDGAWLPQLFRDPGIQIAVLQGPELRYLGANEAFLRAVGDRPVIGRTLREVWPEFEGTGRFEMTETVYASGRPYVAHALPARWSRADGPARSDVDLFLQPLRAADGTVNGLALFAIDVTDAVANGVDR
jgi:DNA-binding CsgD family transcriptional regulator